MEAINHVHSIRGLAKPREMWEACAEFTLKQTDTQSRADSIRWAFRMLREPKLTRYLEAIGVGP